MRKYHKPNKRNKKGQFKSPGIKTNAMKTVEKKFGKSIKELYKELYLEGGMGQGRFAKHIGISKNTVFSKLPDGKKSWVQRLGLKKKPDGWYITEK